jgi:amino acid adenylation domain-containing protein
MSEPVDRVGETSPEGLQILLQRVASRRGRKEPARIPALPRDGAPCPLSFAQERLWFLDQLQPGSPVYNIAGVVQISGLLSAPALAAALAAVVQRHEALRTTFAATEAGPVQIVGEPFTPALPVIDLQALPRAAREAALQRRTAAESRRSFDLQTGPLLRAMLFRRAPDDHHLLFVMHHIVADGESVRVLVDEVAQLYAAWLDGREAELPELPRQYSDYAAWQTGWLQGEVLDSRLAAWKSRLAGLPALDLPADRSRARVASTRGGRVAIAIPETTAAALRRFGERQRATPFMRLLTGFAVFLQRHTGAEDFAIAFPVASRNRSELEPLIGFFANTLILRLDCSGDPVPEVLLGRVRDAVIDALAHQDLPFEKLVAAIEPARERGRPPLAQVMLAAGNVPFDLRLPGLSLRLTEPDTGTAKLDLLLSLDDGRAELSGYLEYSADLFDRTTAERMAGRLEVVLGALARYPERPISALEAWSEAERHQVSVEWNDTQMRGEGGRRLDGLFSAQAAATPQAEALVCGDVRLTYAELEQRSNRLARHLRRLGVGPEVLVGVLMGRSAELVVALLAVLKGGGAYVPLDAAYPRQRLALVLADTSMPVLLSESRWRERISPRPGLRTVWLDELDLALESGTALAPVGDERSLAYVIYTSGSTGRPKGVAIEHASAAALVEWSRQAFAPAELAAVLASTSVCFDLSVFEIFVPLSRGGRVVVVENVLELAEPGWSEAVTLLNTVPSAMTELVRLERVPASVVTVNLAGEPLRRELALQVLGLGSVRRLLNLYGPTEDTTYSTLAKVAGEEPRPVTIGRPVGSTRVSLLDRELRPVPLGAVGELCLGGWGLARGYLGRPELTAERFVPDPLAGVSGGRLYRTGDLARYRSDGELEFLGRLDHQVKIRGFRIEPGEVEAVLASHGKVRACAVVAREDGPGARRLVAYVVPAGVVAVREVRDHLRSRLPEHMVPSAFVVLDELPLTPNGKLDRKRLPAPEEAEHARVSRASAPPRTPVEEVVASVLAGALGRERVGREEDFFELGGHSLLASRVVARLRQAFAVELALRKLFEAPTVAGLAAAVEGALAAGSALRLAPIQPVPRAGELPLSFAQERLWLLDQLEPEIGLYNIPLALRCRGTLEPEVLARALARILDRHEVLRTGFPELDGLPRQKVEDSVPLELARVDLGDLPEAEREERWLAMAHREARRPFDLARGPLLRAVLAAMSPQEHRLLLVVHHIAADGHSIDLLIDDIASLYGSLATGSAETLPALPVQYADYAVWQRRRLEAGDFASQFAYWRRRLAGVSPLELPVDRPRISSGAAGAVRRQALSAELSQRLRAWAREERVSLFTVLLAGFSVLLQQQSGQPDIPIGVPAANRGRPELESVIGLFVNTLVLRVDLAGDPTVRELLAGVWRLAVEAYSNQDLPFDKIVEDLQPKRSLSRNPLFQVMLNLQSEISGRSLGSLVLEPEAIETGSSKFDLTLLAVDRAQDLDFFLEYRSDLFDAATVERLLCRLVALLEAMAVHPEWRVSELEAAGTERYQAARTATGAPGGAAMGLDLPLVKGAPLTPMEEMVASVLAGVLGRERVGRDEDFFELGGHSLLAAQAVARLRQAFSVELSLRRLFEAPTVAGLALAVEAALAAGGTLRLPPIRPVPRDGELPLSFAQERLWFLAQMEGGSATYNLPAAVSLYGDLDAAALEAALRALVSRHEALRTVFGSLSGRPYQAIASRMALTLPVVDIEGLEGARKDEELARLETAAARQVFDLESGPLFSFQLVRRARFEHSLLLCLHHIIADGWSIGVLTRDLAAFYAAFRRGASPSLPPLPVQYADYASWQRQQFQEQALAAQLAYWRGRLAGAPPTLDLPTDRPRPAFQSYRGARHELVVPPGLTSRLRSLGASHGTTLFMTLLSAFATLLGKWSGQEDVVVGSPIAGRHDSALDSLIGLFLNNLVLRVDLAGDPPFLELLGRVRRLALEAYSHQDVPFEKLLEELQPERDFSRTPLFQVFFNMLNFPLGTAEVPGLRIEAASALETPAKFDLTLYVKERETGVHVDLVYNADFFDPATVTEMADQLAGLLGQIADRPEERIGRFSLLTPASLGVLPDPRRELSAEWLGAVHEIFSRWAQRAPERPAVVDPEETWTYGELEAQSNRLAHFLLDGGISPGDAVAIFAHRSAAVVWSVLAVMKAGGVFVLLDPVYPASRLLDCLRLAEPRAWIEVAAAGPPPAEVGDFLDALPKCLRFRATRRGDAGGEGLLARFPETGPGLHVGPDDVALIAFTSGSTGMPKGIIGRHGPLSHFVPWQCREFGLEARDRFSALSGLAHDPLQRDMFTPLQIGAAVCFPDPEQMGAPGWLAGWMARERVTVAHLTPAMGQLLAETAVAARMPSLRYAFFVGDVLTWFDVERLHGIAPAVTCVNFYGSTETQRAVGYYAAAPLPPVGAIRERQVLPLGRGMQDVQLLVLNGAGQQAGVGELGEICVRSPHLARGYLGDPELTRAKFLANAFTGHSGDRMYRTGDLGRYRHDGNLRFAGRADQQVKVRGFRVEPGEIEAILGRHPAIQEAVVTVREDVPGERWLVGYYVSRQGELSTANLRGHLRQHLPEYMVPTAFVHLAALPLTPNRKLDRRALPPPALGPGENGPSSPPQNALEQEVALLWGEVLRLQGVGREDNFFERGGHSLLATRLAARIHDALHVELPLRALFEAPTVAGMAAAVAAAAGRKGAAMAASPALPAILPDREGRHQPFGLTDVQEAYWIGRSGAYELGSVSTHVYFEFEAAGLDLRRLTAALRRVIERHDMLRAIFLPDGRQQILERVPPYSIAVLDLADLPPEARERALAAVREEMSHEVLPAGHWPLFNLRASRLPSGRLRLHVGLDLLIADALSVRILERELLQLIVDPAAPLAPLELSFRDYVLAERALEESEPYRRALAYWQSQLATLPPAPELPLAVNPAVLGRPRFVRRSAILEADTWRRLKRRAHRIGLTPSALLIAAFSEVLAVWSKAPRFTLNVTLFNRLPLHPQVNEIVGDFTSLFLLEADAAAEPAFEDRARRLQQRLWSHLEHRMVGGVRVLRELRRARGAQGNASAMPVVFTSTLGLPERQAQMARSVLDGETVYSISQTPQVWLDHQVSESGGALSIVWDAVEGLFPQGLLDDAFAVYQRILRLLADGEGGWGMPVLAAPPEEQLRPREEVNATEAPVPQGLLHQGFLAQAARQPEAVAVVSPAGALSYRELHARSSDLAVRLRRLGARPNGLVAVVMEKGWEQLAGVLAVLSAGAAYLPVDPSLPRQRRFYLLEHGEVKVALTQPWLDRDLEWPAGVTRLVVDAGEPAGEEEEALPVVQSAEDLAYVIFTSGSTGLPKGVMIDHRGALNTVVDVNGRFRVGPQDRVLSLSALSFDLSVWDVFGLLAAGGSVVLPEPSELRDPESWLQAIRRCGVTVWNTVPALMEMLVEYLEGRGETLPESLRLVLLSGDWIPVRLPERIRRLAPGAEVVSLGGATEASIWSILYPIERVDPEWKSIPYGRPMKNQRFYVLDEKLDHRPDWVAGQLFIAGVGLARGYWRDEEKTRASFILNPVTGERLYRTGDLGRWLPDGTIEFLGREDFQVKVRGYRVELGEIEAALSQCAGVLTAAVTAVGEPRGAKRLVGYAVPAPGVSVGGEELRELLRGKLPEYMVPASLRIVESLPLTANGKVDRSALRDSVEPAAAGRPSASGSATAGKIADLVARCLRLEAIDDGKSLFELGASSIEIVRIANLLESEFGLRPTMGELLHLPNVQALAAFYEGRLGAADLEPEDWQRRAAGESTAPSMPWDLLIDPRLRESFKESRPGLRRDTAGAEGFVLGSAAGGVVEIFSPRRSWREFADRPLHLADLADLLAVLGRVQGETAPRHLFGSAGALYPVQTYVYVKPRRFSDLPAGGYYHHPEQRQLQLLSPGGRLEKESFGRLNRDLFESSSFAIFLIGQMSAIGPMYGAASRDFCLIESGLMTQLLETAAPYAGLGLCQVASCDMAHLCDLFKLEETHIYLHALVGGPLSRRQEFPVPVAAAGGTQEWEEGEL